MTELFFSEPDPILHAESVEWSNKIHQNPSASNVDAIIDEAYAETLNHYQRLEPHTANRNAAGLARATVARVVGHYAAVELASLATRLLEEDQLIDLAMQDERMRLIDNSTPGFVMDFGRVWYGNTARLMAAFMLMTEGPNSHLLQILPTGIYAGMERTGTMMNAASNAKARSLGYDTSSVTHSKGSRHGNQWQPTLTLDNGVESGLGRRPNTWATRYLIDAAIVGVSRTAPEFLERNTITSVEHIGGLMSDILHEFHERTPNLSPARILEATLAALHLFHKLAFMSNLLNGKAEYDYRYVWKGPDEPDCYTSAREPLVKISTTENGNYVIRSNSEARTFADAARRTRGKCPGPDALTPLGTEEETFGKLRQALQSAVREEYLADTQNTNYSCFDRNFSHIDILVILAATVSARLIERGTKFDDTYLYLGPPEEATSLDSVSHLLRGRFRQTPNQARLAILREEYRKGRKPPFDADPIKTSH